MLFIGISKAKGHLIQDIGKNIADKYYQSNIIIKQ
jgi:hypothetical protein